MRKLIALLGAPLVLVSGCLMFYTGARKVRV